MNRPHLHGGADIAVGVDLSTFRETAFWGMNNWCATLIHTPAQVPPSWFDGDWTELKSLTVHSEVQKDPNRFAFSWDLTEGVHRRFGGYVAAQLAVWLGVRSITLVGMDLIAGVHTVPGHHEFREVSVERQTHGINSLYRFLSGDGRNRRVELRLLAGREHPCVEVPKVTTEEVLG